MRILVTGGAGFIGSNFVRYLLARYGDEVVVLDKLTYAGNLDNPNGLEGDARFRFIRGDIADPDTVLQAINGVDWVVNFAAESHVDRSIMDPSGFITTDVYGPYVLLEAAREAGAQRFVQVSTDEVYGEVPEGSVDETAPLRPRSPYAASKAGASMAFRSLDLRYAKRGVRFKVATLGPIQTAMWEGRHSMLVPSSASAAKALAGFLSSDKASLYFPFITTTLLRLSLWLPDAFFALVSRKLLQ